ncbi:uncharacterized protein LOC111242544 isoform X2 [Vigna radiata var. radiata]|uniref:Uncharacterized protein LOC111242544 isoform X2 n=1 Tax=Vigna radiata var. radiata TaxID=3916 RepID=A0A3Q0FD71_VIGRR|nr:uncharacterized protein LOC111242544 isoform X2 [Vigna radiata var. radiata]
MEALALLSWWLDSNCEVVSCRFGGSTEVEFEEDEDTRGFTVFTHGSCEIGILSVFSFLLGSLLREAIDVGGQDKPRFLHLAVVCKPVLLKGLPSHLPHILLLL